MLEITLSGGENDALGKVRGMGSYNQMFAEAVETYGQKYGVRLSASAEVVLHTNFIFQNEFHFSKKNKNIVVLHDLIPLLYKNHFPLGWRGFLRSQINTWKLRAVDGVITDTEYVKAQIQKMFPFLKNKVVVIYPSTKRIFFENNEVETRNEKSPSLPKNYLLYVGDVTWNKNLETLVMAIKKTKQTLVLVGQALVKETDLQHPWKKSLVKVRELTKNNTQFIFLGFVDDTTLLQVYKQAKALIFPSYDEGFGLPWLEGALLSVPVILSDIPVLREISDSTSLYVNPLQVDEMVTQIEQVVNSDNRQLIANQKARAQFFSHENFVKQLASVIPTLIGTN